MRKFAVIDIDVKNSAESVISQISLCRLCLIQWRITRFLIITHFNAKMSGQSLFERGWCILAQIRLMDGLTLKADRENPSILFLLCLLSSWRQWKRCRPGWKSIKIINFWDCWVPSASMIDLISSFSFFADRLQYMRLEKVYFHRL